MTAQDYVLVLDGRTAHTQDQSSLPQRYRVKNLHALLFCQQGWIARLRQRVSMCCLCYYNEEPLTTLRDGVSNLGSLP